MVLLADGPTPKLAASFTCASIAGASRETGATDMLGFVRGDAV
jgi:hypothetical protein